jgi:hypothetical protein
MWTGDEQDKASHTAQNNAMMAMVRLGLRM